MFLPPNVISLCPPMDQGVITMLKKIYITTDFLNHSEKLLTDAKC